jgi:hypothetical protein
LGVPSAITPYLKTGNRLTKNGNGPDQYLSLSYDLLRRHINFDHEEESPKQLSDSKSEIGVEFVKIRVFVD